jgi:hypothetical protein
MARKTTEPFQMRRRNGLESLAALACLLVLWLAARPAHAYPQWQLTSGAGRCNQCHFAPAGGGLLTSHGRDAAGDELSTIAGNGGFLHGAVDLPGWLALGFDGRGALISHDAGGPKPDRALFPMQADLLGRAALSDAWSLALTVGYRGSARDADAGVAADNYTPAAASGFISREHYVMWRPDALGPYLRAGRFFAPYGLRLAEHTTYVRRDLGYNLLEESYAVSGGVVREAWEVHVTAFGPDWLRQGGSRQTGVAALFERRLGDSIAVGASTRLARGDGSGQYAGGLFGKGYLAPIKTLLMGEVDLVNHAIEDVAATRQLVAFAGITVFPLRGLWLGGFVERDQTSIAVKDAATNALDGQVNWFPYPHFELVLLGRLQQPAGQSSAKTVLFQGHYFL